MDARAFRGDLIRGAESRDGWHHVRLRNGVEGWVAGWVVAKADEHCVSAPAFNGAEPTPEHPLAAQVVSDGVGFRTEPRGDLPARTDHTRAGALPAGAIITVNGRQGHWLRVPFTSLFSGWVYDEALAPAAAPPAVWPGAPQFATDEESIEIIIPLERPAAYWVRPLPFLAGVEIILFGVSCPAEEIPPELPPAAYWKCHAGENALQITMPAPDGRLAGYDAAWRDGAFRARLKRLPHGRPLTIVLDPGHGAPEPAPKGFAAGAESGRGVKEKDVNLDIALRLRDLLEARGHRALLTRTGDTLDMLDLYRRVDFARQANPDFVLSIHANGDTNKGVAGAEVYWFNEQSQPLAAALAAALGRDTGRPEGKALFGSFAVIRDPLAPAVLIETGYLSNAREGALLGSPAFRQKCAEAVAATLENYVAALNGE